MAWIRMELRWHICPASQIWYFSGVGFDVIVSPARTMPSHPTLDYYCWGEHCGSLASAIALCIPRPLPMPVGKEWGHCYTMHYHLLIDSVVILLPSCNFRAQKACIVNEQFCWCMYWVCVEHLRSVVVPYSGKPSREKTFTNISILVPSVSFLHNILGIPHPYQGFI